MVKNGEVEVANSFDDVTANGSVGHAPIDNEGGGDLGFEGLGLANERYDFAR